MRVRASGPMCARAARPRSARASGSATRPCAPAAPSPSARIRRRNSPCRPSGPCGSPPGRAGSWRGAPRPSGRSRRSARAGGARGGRAALRDDRTEHARAPAAGPVGARSGLLVKPRPTMNWPAAQKNEPRGDSTVAAVLTWILPGAGHFYLGMPVFGLCAFLLVQGLYFLGLRLSDGMLFEYLEPDLQSAFAGVLTPEVGNLGGLVYHMKVYGYGIGHMRPWPDAMWIGCWLTACSGILNACLMVQAHSDARAPKNA